MCCVCVYVFVSGRVRGHLRGRQEMHEAPFPHAERTGDVVGWGQNSGQQCMLLRDIQYIFGSCQNILR